MTAHTPIRPTWRCAADGLGWPCPARTRQLLAEYAGNPTGLMVYLAAEMVDCARDHPDTAPGDLVTRFLALPAAAATLPRRDAIEHYNPRWHR